MPESPPAASDSSMPPVNPSMAAAVLESSYRLTAAISIVARRLEDWDWLEYWVGETRESIDALLRFVNPLSATLPPGIWAAPLQESRATLAHLLTTWIQNVDPNTPAGTNDALLRMLTHTHEKLWHGLGGPPATPWPAATLRSYHQLGVMLALDDLNAFLLYVNKKTHPFTMWWDRPTRVNVDGHSPATPSSPDQMIGHEFDVNVIPAEFWGPLADDRFVRDVNELFAKRKTYVTDGTVFAPGGWIRVLLAALAPERAPSAAWIWPEPPGAKPRWRIIVAGRHVQKPAMIVAKNNGGHDLIELIDRMIADKTGGVTAADAGWMSARALRNNPQADTRKKARQALEALTAPMGTLDYVDGRKSREPHYGCCRLPGCWAGSDVAMGRHENK